MSDEVPPVAVHPLRTTAASSPRQLIETIVAILQQNDVPSTLLHDLLGRLAESLDDWLSPRLTNKVYEPAIQHAPWLTPEVERLRRDQSTLRQSLQSIRQLAGRVANSVESVQQLAQQFNDFVVHFVDCEAAEQNLMHDAFPGPDWVEET